MFFVSFAATAGFPTCLEGQSEGMICIQLVSICNLTTAYHKIPHTVPLMCLMSILLRESNTVTPKYVDKRFEFYGWNSITKNRDYSQCFIIKNVKVITLEREVQFFIYAKPYFRVLLALMLNFCKLQPLRHHYNRRSHTNILSQSLEINNI